MVEAEMMAAVEEEMMVEVAAVMMEEEVELMTAEVAPTMVVVGEPMTAEELVVERMMAVVVETKWTTKTLAIIKWLTLAAAVVAEETEWVADKVEEDLVEEEGCVECKECKECVECKECAEECVAAAFSGVNTRKDN